MFGGLNKKNEVVRVRKIIEKFVEVSFLSLTHIDSKSPDQGRITLLYMFGALDMLSQVKGLDTNITLELFKNMLKEELGGYSEEEAQVILREIIQATAEQEGQNLMKEGGEAIRTWLIGEDSAAPHRLTEILLKLDP